MLINNTGNDTNHIMMISFWLYQCNDVTVVEVVHMTRIQLLATLGNQQTHLDETQCCNKS